ncbi:MAG: family 16 glycoside hydrolase [Pirellulaceae bacterium]
MRHLPWFLALLSAACFGPFTTTPAWGDEDGFESIFDGKTLDGWDGNPKFWSVRDGAITGQTTQENPTQGNTFIIWRKEEVSDFELKLEYKLIGGNSGIQYRSFQLEGDDEWRIGGYQADFEAGDRYSGILYGERYRGILADRGQKTVIGEGGKVKVVGSVGESAEIQTKIKKEDWNEYHIIARGNHFVHKINGVTTCEATDEDSAARTSGLLALQLHQGPPMTVQFRNLRLKRLAPGAKENASSSDRKTVVFVAGPKSHGYGGHEHHAGCLLLAKYLEAGMPNFKTRVYHNGWPIDPKAFDGADAIVIFCDGGGRHVAIPHLEEVDRLAKQGVGIANLHYAVEVPKDHVGKFFLEWMGGYFEANWSVNPHWTAKFDDLPDHPITRGVQPFEAGDEWYYHMRFREKMEGVTPILSVLPPADTLKRPDGVHSNNPHVRAAVLERKEPQHVAWASENENGGRGFGFTGGHWHWNWGKPDFLKVVLNAVVWIAGGDVPADGVPAPAITLTELKANQDYEPNAKVDFDRIRERFSLIGEKR